MGKAQGLLGRCAEYLEDLRTDAQPVRTRDFVDACIECGIPPPWNMVINFFLQGRADQLVDRWTGLRRLGLNVETINTAALCKVQCAARSRGHEGVLAAVEGELEARGVPKTQGQNSQPRSCQEQAMLEDGQDIVAELRSVYKARQIEGQRDPSAVLSRWGVASATRPSSARVMAC